MPSELLETQLDERRVHHQVSLLTGTKLQDAGLTACGDDRAEAYRDQLKGCSIYLSSQALVGDDGWDARSLVAVWPSKGTWPIRTLKKL